MDDLNDMELESTLDTLEELISAYESFPSIVNPSEMQKMRLVYKTVMYLSGEFGGSVSYKLNEPFPFCGSISWDVPSLRLLKTSIIFSAIDMADVVDINAFKRGVISIDFGFNHLTTPIETLL